MKKKITILLTCAGGDLSVQNIKLFKKSKVYEKINIIGVDTKKTVVAKLFLDKYLKKFSLESGPIILSIL